jgi:hypothetical protein
MQFINALLVPTIFLLAPAAMAQKDKLSSEVKVTNTAESPVVVTYAPKTLLSELRVAEIECEVLDGSWDQAGSCSNDPFITDSDDDIVIYWIQGRAISSDIGKCEATLRIWQIPPPGTVSIAFPIFMISAPGGYGHVSDSIIYSPPINAAFESKLQYDFGWNTWPEPPSTKCSFKFLIGYRNK